MARDPMPTDAAGSAPFEKVLSTHDPFRVQDEMFVRLEDGRREHMEAERRALSQDRKDLEGALKDLQARTTPERLSRLSGLIALVDRQQAEVEATVAALKDPPAIPAGGWLLIGRVREANGDPPKGGQIKFEGGETDRRLPPIKIPANGQVRLALDAETVTEITRHGEAQVQIAATVGDRSVEDVAPASITPGGVHQFDLILPAPKPPRRPPDR
ncbi:MAG: hypothetical protein ACREE0_06020 [Phenylobacterium sp.]